LVCSAECLRYSGADDILPLIRTEKVEQLECFLADYRTVRRAEGWGGSAEYYRRLPFDFDGPHRNVWRVRARSYRETLAVLERHFRDVKTSDEWNRSSLRIVELGAGNGWFAFRMATAGHYVLATDICMDEEDGLRAVARYAGPGHACRERLTLARAEMEDLPLADAQFDVAVANASFHYARDMERAVREARRLVRAGGLLLVADSPTYDDEATGLSMVQRREQEHYEKFAIESTYKTAGFLVEQDFVSLLQRLGFGVHVHRPFEGLSRRLRRVSCRLRGAHHPARFPLFVAERF
jgi:SAM-dependent methyltransferase